MSTRELIDMCSKSAGRRRDWALWCAEQQNPAERLVRVTFADGEVLELRGERGVAERWAQYYECSPGVPAGWRELQR